MAKLQDKFFNRVIEGDLELGENENSQVVKAVEDTSSLKVFENIVDKDGHSRFIEGELATETIEGVDFTYAKWSLSGSHLLIVLCGSVSQDATLATDYFATLNLPEWLGSKIVALFSNIVEQKSYPMYASDYTTQTGNVRLLKTSDKIIQIRNIGSTTLTKDRVFRISFDLLIDNKQL